MQILGNLFNILIFVSMLGSVLTIMTLLARKTLHITMSLWFCICELAFYLVPIMMPTLWVDGGRQRRMIIMKSSRHRASLCFSGYSSAF